MRFRFEVGRARSSTWGMFVRLAKRQERYRLDQDEDAGEVHVIETDDVETALALWSYVARWRGVVYYFDNRLASRTHMARIMWDLRERGGKVAAMLHGILGKAAASRERREQERRWRMGLGPERPEDLGF